MTRRVAARYLLLHLVRYHVEAHQRARTEYSGQCNVGGIAPTSHQDAADSRRVMACVEGVPVTAEIGLEPRAEVHREVHRRDADVAEVAGAIARRNVHAAAQGDSQMREVATYPATLGVAGESRAGWVGVVVAELDVVVHIVADRLHPGPAFRRIAEQRPRKLRELVCFTIPAAKQIQQRVLRQILDGMLWRIGNDCVRCAGVADDESRRDAQDSGGCQNAMADVAEAVTVFAGPDRWIEANVVCSHHVSHA